MAVTERIKREIWAIYAGRCALCKSLLIDSSLGPDRTSLIGEVAHIIAEQVGGPRGVSTVSMEQRNLKNNLLLLCLDHHKVIDDHPEQYPVHILKAAQENHLSWVSNRLQQGAPWVGDLQNLFYLNVPRLEILARCLGEPIKDTDYTELKNLKSLGGGVIRFLAFFEELLENLHPNALRLEDLRFDESIVGCIYAYSSRFRTKNVGKALDRHEDFFVDLKDFPHIYCEVTDYKLILPIDVRWITTTTAGVTLSSGQGVFSGLCLINSIDDAAKTIYASPLIIGQPVNPQLSDFRLNYRKIIKNI